VLVPVVYSLFHAERKNPIDNGQRTSLWPPAWRGRGSSRRWT